MKIQTPTQENKIKAIIERGLTPLLALMATWYICQQPEILLYYSQFKDISEIYYSFYDGFNKLFNLKFFRSKKDAQQQSNHESSNKLDAKEFEILFEKMREQERANERINENATF